jgi:antitoxin component YwqK of YwqJK toxin-antitoxin module
MKYPLLFSLLILCAACASKSGPKEDHLTSIQMIDRHGFSETVSAKERLSRYQSVDFLSPQPYQRILRVFNRDSQGRTHAKLTCYHPNGQISQFLEVVDGRAHGPYREWHANGTKKIEAQVIEGVADLSPMAQSSWLFDGKSSVWDEAGNCLAEIFYSKGVLEGVSKYYYPSHQLQKEVPFVQNEIHGTEILYAENGEVEEKISYVNGLREGVALGFWPDKSEKYTEVYEKDKLKKGIYFSQNKELISEVKEGAGKQAVFQKGKLLSLITFQQGVPEGLIQIFNEKGELSQEYHVQEGKKTGEEREYYPPNKEGKLLPKLSVTWHEDLIHGLTKTWYPTGAMESQKEISSNKKHGMSFAWYKEGGLMFTEEYDNEKLVRGSYFKKGEKEPISKIEGGKGVATLYDADGKFLKKISYEKGKPLLTDE